MRVKGNVLIMTVVSMVVLVGGLIGVELAPSPSLSTLPVPLMVIGFSPGT